LQWNSTASTNSYKIRLSTDGTFATGVSLYTVDAPSTNFFLSSPLANATTYYWDVASYSLAGGNGCSSPVSSRFEFVNAALLPFDTVNKAACTYPCSGAGPGTFSWAVSGNATEYRLKFSSIDTSLSSSTSTWYVTPGTATSIDLLDVSSCNDSWWQPNSGIGFRSTLRSEFGSILYWTVEARKETGACSGRGRNADTAYRSLTINPGSGGMGEGNCP